MEALCFGWIDGQIKSIDETTYMKRFSPRRKGSKWSGKNRLLAQNLLEQGLMTEYGIAAINRAKPEGTWDAQVQEPVVAEQIAVLSAALQGLEPASSNYANMSPSVRKTYAAHYLAAKTEGTRNRRLQEIVERLNNNLKPM